MEISIIERELTSLLNKLTDEICADQKEMEVLKKRITSNINLRVALQTRLGATKSAAESATYGTRWDNIRKAIRQVAKQRFSQDDIEAEIKRLDPDVEIDRSRLRATLWTFQSKGELIKQVRKGNNQEPALFERLANTDNHAGNGASSVTEAHRTARGIAANGGVITVGDLEAYVREKNRRMNELTERFNADEKTLRGMFEPQSRVFMATHGWVKIRE
jgi:hypothetical protein